MTEPTAFSRQLGANIRAARQAAGLRSCEFAAAIGVWRSAMTRIEQGAAGLSINRLRWAAEALGVSAASLLPH
jgi:transcriptional regulator with XRE-family HTH domain